MSGYTVGPTSFSHFCCHSSADDVVYSFKNRQRPSCQTQSNASLLGSLRKSNPWSPFANSQGTWSHSNHCCFLTKLLQSDIVWLIGNPIHIHNKCLRRSTLQCHHYILCSIWVRSFGALAKAAGLQLFIASLQCVCPKMYSIAIFVDL